MRKIFTIFTLLFALNTPLAFISNASAQVDPLEDACEGISDASICNTDGENDPISGSDGIIMNVVEILSWVVGLASVLMIMLGGLKFITANGDANSISSARNTVLYALIGVAVFLASQLIIRFVISRI